MRKLFIIAVALLLIAGLTMPAGAEDRLSMRGDYYLRAISVDNPGFDSDADADTAYFTQRIRMIMQVKPSDDVRVELRLDWGEAEWGMHRTGTTGRGGAIPIDDEVDGVASNGYQQVQIEHANVRWEKDLFVLVVGQQGQTFGNGGTWRPQETGIALRLKLPVLIDLNFFKAGEGGSITDYDDQGTEDLNFYGAQVSYQASKMFKAGIFYAAKDDLQTDDNPYTVGLWGGVNIGPVALDGQLDVFGGDDGAGTDYVGTQVVVDARVPLMEILTLGADAFYTAGTDSANEQVMTRLNVYGPWGNTMISGLPGLMWDGIRYTAVFDAHNIIGGNAGEIGGDVWVSVTPIKGLTVGGQGMYFVPAEDDEAVTSVDAVYGFGAGVSYALAPTMTVGVGGIYYQKEFNDDTIPDDGSLGLQLSLAARY